MNLLLKRLIYTDHSTMGDIFIGEEFQTNSLEPTCRNRDKNLDGKLSPEEKVKNLTAIPAGRYQIKMSWSNHFQRNMPHLLNVPLFADVMIHWGNYPKDTQGCICTGKQLPDIVDFISESQKAYNDLEKKIITGLKTEPVFISILGGYVANV